MDNAALTVQVRDTDDKAKALRREGFIPAEYYGNGVENLSIQMDYQSFRRLYRQAGDNTVIDLNIEGKGAKKVLVHNVDYDPVSGNYMHVDFIHVNMNEEVTTHVPIVLEGLAPAVKELGGVLMQNLDQIEIRCLPAHLLHEITLNVESLVDFHSVLHVSDIKLPSTVELLTDPSVTVATVVAPREEEPETVEEVDVASVEVTSEKKEEEA